MALVAHYKLDGDANDSGPNQLHGTATNVTWTDGKINQAGNFNGTTAYISRASVTGFPTGNVTATISAGVYYRTFENAWEGIAGGGNRGLSTVCMLSTNNGRPALNTGGSVGTEDILADSPISLNSWNHIVGTIQNRNIKLYVNGSLVKEGTITAIPNVAAVNFTIGSLDYPGRYSDANIDDVRIYNHTLSEFEIRELALFHPSANLVAHYPLDDDALDYSGNKLHGASTNVVFQNGKIKRSAYFNGSDSVIQLPNFPQIFNNSVSLSAGVYYTDTSRSIIFGNYALSPAINFERIGSDLRLYGSSGSIDVYSSGGISINTGHHIVIIRNKEENKIEFGIDGELNRAVSGIGLDVPSAPSPFRIGRDSRTGTTTTLGNIDDLRIYNKALSESEIKSLAQAKIAHYKLGDKNEQATQNLCYNLSLDYYDKSRFYSTDGNGFTEVMYLGKKWMRYDSGNRRLASIPIAANTTYTGSLKIISPSASNISFTQWDGTSYGYGIYPIIAGYNEISHTFTSNATSTYEILHISSFPVNSLLADFQLEQRNYATPITKGVRNGTIIKDSTYNNNHGSVTLATSPKWSSDTAVGLGSMEFNGTSHFIKIPKYTSATDSTISMGVKGTVTTGYRILMGSYNSLAIGFGDRKIIGVCDGVANSPTGDLGTTFINGEGNHIVVKREANDTMKYFCNGVLLPNTTSNKGTGTDSEYAYIGRRTEANAGSPYYGNGSMADVQIFATALSDEDIYNLFASKSKLIKFNSSTTSKLILDNTKTGAIKSKITK